VKDTDLLEKFIRPTLDKIGYKVVAEIQRRSREMGIIDSGAFVRSIHHKVEGNTVIIQDGVKYGKFLEFGTTAHFVAPVTKQYLSWIEKKTGKRRFSKGHVVSGIEAYAPFRKGIDVAMRSLRI
jgi:hypothetical protein